MQADREAEMEPLVRDDEASSDDDDDGFPPGFIAIEEGGAQEEGPPGRGARRIDLGGEFIALMVDANSKFVSK